MTFIPGRAKVTFQLLFAWGPRQQVIYVGLLQRRVTGCGRTLSDSEKEGHEQFTKRNWATS